MLGIGLGGSYCKKFAGGKHVQVSVFTLVVGFVIFVQLQEMFWL